MNDLEDSLRNALRRQEPPDGFVDRVMARVPERRPAARTWQRQWLAAAAAAAFAIIGGTAWEQHRRQVEGEKAKHELIYALSVASGALQTTKEIITR